MLSPSLMQLLIGGILAAIAAVISWALHWLKGIGALAAFVLGICFTDLFRYVFIPLDPVQEKEGTGRKIV